ncbi:MAG: hypothetical protein RL660_2426 [Bacteroidota bacterium]|jgi:CysZ protein
MLQQIITASDAYIESFALIRKNKMWPLILMSGLLYLVLIAFGLYGVWEGMHSLVDWAMDFSWIKKCNDYLALKWLVKILAVGIYIASFFVYFSIFKFLLLTIASPLYAYISERTEAALTGREYAFSLPILIQDIIRGVRISIRNLFRQSFFTLLLLLLSFIPLVGIISSACIILLDAYYYGFAMLDYVCERKRMNTKDSLAFVRAHTGLALGNGLIFYVLFLIPFVGIVIGAPLSAVAATISVHKLKKL